MTKTEAAIVTAYTGVLIGNFADFHAYAEDLMGRKIYTHQFALETFMAELKAAAKSDFIGMEVV